MRRWLLALVAALFCSAPSAFAQVFPIGGVAIRYASNCSTQSGGSEGEVCVDLEDGRLFRCNITTGTCDTGPEWVQIGSLGLKAGNSASALSLLAFSGASPYDVVPTLCVLNTTLDGISCPANATEGQALQLLEPAGADYWRLKVRGAMSVTKQQYVEADGSVSGLRPWLSEESTPGTPDAGFVALYAAPKIGGYASLNARDDAGELYALVTSNGGGGTSGTIPMWTVTGGPDLQSSSLSYDATLRELRFVTSGTTHYYRSDVYNSDTATAADCNNSAEQGRIMVKSGTSVTGGNGGLCVCVAQGGSATPAWECY